MVELVLQNYDENVSVFNKQKENLLKNLSCPVQISHVGSTAIKDMYGKNILDILVGVKNENDFSVTFSELEKLGFLPSKNPQTSTSIYHFFASSEGETKSGDIHIHLCIMGTERYDEFLILKTYLISHPEEAKEYSDHKIELINKGFTNRKIYKAEKSKYVSDLISRAKQSVNYKTK